MFRLLSAYAYPKALIPAAAIVVMAPAGVVVGVGEFPAVAVAFGMATGDVVGVMVAVADTAVSGGAVTVKVCISTAEEPYGYSPDLES